ncbi:MAG: SCP2 sterol-binding domain-containing protein [Gemmatimonadales bacterium]
MPHPIFSDAWARACAERLNARDAYRAAAATWEGAILLRMHKAGGEARRVFLDLWHGECRAARAGTAEDEEAARYILDGEPAAWEQVLTGRVAPLLAIMTGKLKLAKGSLAELLPYVNAAKELVSAAAEVDAIFADARD